MKRMRVLARDTVLGAVLTAGIVAFVLGQTVVGLVVVSLSIWQFTLLYRGKGGLLVDQRWADVEGKPRIRSK